MALICICGSAHEYNMGNNKTALMTLLTKLDYDNGRTIAANYSLDNKVIKNTYLKNVDDLILFLFENPNVTIPLDELSSWFSCYVKPKDEGLYMAELAKQTRKLDQKIYYTAQYFEQVQRSLRVLTQKIYHVSKNHKVGNKFIPCFNDDCYKQHYVSIQEMRSINNQLFPISKKMYYKMPLEIFNVYDTREIITSDRLRNYIEQLKEDKVKDETLLCKNQYILNVMNEIKLKT